MIGSSSISVVRFLPEHLVALQAQAAQPELAGDRRARAAALSAAGRCFTAVRLRDQAPIFCGGAVPTHAGYATLWGACAADIGPAMLGVERRVRRFIELLDEPRVDAIIRRRHDAGRRWAARLGFVAEAVLHDYFENGEDAVIYRLTARA